MFSNTEKIAPSEIEVGKVLPWGVYNSRGFLLLKKGAIIKSERHLKILLEGGIFRNNNEVKANDEDQQPIEEIASPFALIAEFSERLKNVFTGILEPIPDVEKRIIRLSEDIQGLCIADADALIGAIHLYHDLEYTANHPIHTAIICEIFTAELGYSKKERIDILGAALTSNIAILELQKSLHRQSGPMTGSQREEMEAHPQRGIEILQAAGISNELWLRIVVQHHERLNGSGYPQELSGGDIAREAQIVSLADVYAAMSVSKAYREAHTANFILRGLLLDRGKEHDEKLCLQLIKIFGVFPPGSFVRLENGEVAVVIKRAVENSMWPVVKSILSPRGGPYTQPLRRDCKNENYRIKEMCAFNKDIPLNLHSLWGYS